MLTDYREIYQGEIFVKSQCIELENSLMDFFRRNLSMLGYESISSSGKIWQRGNKKVIVCLVDDIVSCADMAHIPVSSYFDSNTLIITDNRIYSPTQYRVLQLPDSFFGIYYYKPELTEFNPVKRFNFSINRIDSVRLVLLLEMAKWANNNNNLFVNDYVKFNVFNHHQQTANIEFKKTFDDLYPDIQLQYQYEFDALVEQMPFTNYQSSLEQVHISSMLNLVVETYSGSDTVAVSEKIFRALVTPAPWSVYSGRHTVSFLKSLGFDVIDDMLDHSYNSKNYADIFGGPGSKTVDYIWCSTENYKKLQNIAVSDLKTRCKDAAMHNQSVLQRMRSQWPCDFAAWWSNNIWQFK
jgi:hypothetical protein